MNMSPNYNNSQANRNLSSVLSQIQDEGPAYADSSTQRNSADRIAEEYEKSGTATDGTQAAGLYNDDVMCAATGSDLPEKKANHAVLLQLLLLLSAVALFAIILSRFDVRTENIERILSIYDEKIQDSVSHQSEPSPVDMTEINATMQSLQDELRLIKADYSAMDKKYLAMKAKKPVPQVKGASAIQDNVSVLKYEILSLKSELHAVKNKLNISDKDKKSTGSIAASSGLTVALASLTNKTKAEKIVEQLYAEGLLPSIKQAIVKGERVYRLSVSGFSDRNEAELFIRKAGDKYGMKDGLIRKS